MATHSTITKVLENGKCRTIYCHWDGHIDHNGKFLVENYATSDRVDALLDLGNLSLLQPELLTELEHTFKNPIHGVCVAYGRDRGETDQQARVYDDYFPCMTEEYNYLFENGKWFRMRVNSKELVTTLLDELM